MATFTDEILMAFVDGELDPAQAVEVQLALIADETLAKRIERFRYVRRALRSTYDAVVKEPVPDHLLSLLNNIGQSTSADEDVDADDPDDDADDIAAAADEICAPKRTKREQPPVWAAVAASVLIGMLVVRLFSRRDRAE